MKIFDYSISLFLRFIIRGYQLLISPLIPARCRYHPTCSNYALEALVCHGLLNGVILIVKRILKCHPWGGFGDDPVPEKLINNDSK